MKPYLRSCDCTGSFIFWLLVDIRNVSIRGSHCNSSLETSLKFSRVPVAVTQGRKVVNFCAAEAVFHNKRCHG